MVTFPITSPGPLLPLDAPLPQPRVHTLLDVARIIPTSDERWLSGAWINGYPSGRPQIHDPCSEGTFRLKDASAESARPVTGAFTVVQGGSCTARTIGVDSKWYTDRLALAFKAVESTAVEEVLVNGVPGDPLLTPYITDANMEAPVTNTAQTRREGLAILENKLAQVGNGIIHATPAIVALWAGDYLVEQTRDNQIHTTPIRVIPVRRRNGRSPRTSSRLDATTTRRSCRGSIRRRSTVPPTKSRSTPSATTSSLGLVGRTPRTTNIPRSAS